MSEVKQKCKYTCVTGYSLMVPIIPSSETQSQWKKNNPKISSVYKLSPPQKKPKEFSKQLASFKASHFLLKTDTIGIK